LQATTREALEQVHGLVALDAIRREAVAGPKRPERFDTPRFLAGEIDNAVFEPAQSETRVGSPEAKRVADKPNLMGWAEWDELELSETDPTKPLLVVQR
jgi:hypothetical protein